MKTHTYLASEIDVEKALALGGTLHGPEYDRHIRISPMLYVRCRKKEDVVPVSPCAGCGGKVNPAQVKASPAAMEEFLAGA